MQLSAFSFTETSKCIVLRLAKNGNQFVQFMYEDQISHVGIQIIRYEREKLMVYAVVSYYRGFFFTEEFHVLNNKV